ncbi:hypothetical protein Efla_001673 [Eimeria flavescens]
MPPSVCVTYLLVCGVSTSSPGSKGASCELRPVGANRVRNEQPLSQRSDYADFTHCGMWRNMGSVYSKPMDTSRGCASNRTPPRETSVEELGPSSRTPRASSSYALIYPSGVMLTLWAPRVLGATMLTMTGLHEVSPHRNAAYLTTVALIVKKARALDLDLRRGGIQMNNYAESLQCCVSSAGDQLCPLLQKYCESLNELGHLRASLWDCKYSLQAEVELKRLLHINAKFLPTTRSRLNRSRLLIRK